MRSKLGTRWLLTALALSCAVLACSVPEDSSPALRCDESGSCPGSLECYRGFCIGEGDDVEIDAVDAGAIESVGPDSASAVAKPDASAIDATDAGEVVLIQDAPPGPVNVVVTTPVSQPTTPAAVPTPVAESPVPTAIQCLAECAQGGKSKACKSCFKTTYGDDPDKLCGDGSKAASALMVTLCASVCVSGEKGASCQLAFVNCHGPDCEGG